MQASPPTQGISCPPWTASSPDSSTNHSSPPRTSLTIFRLLISVRPFSPARAAVPGPWSSVQQPPCVCAARGPSWLPQPCPRSRLCQPHPNFFSQVLSSLPSSSQCLHEAPTLASGHCLSANEDRERPEMGAPASCAAPGSLSAKFLYRLCSGNEFLV